MVVLGCWICNAQKGPGRSLKVYLKGPGRVLDGSWMGHGRVLEGSWKGPGRVLEGYKGSDVVFIKLHNYY